MITHSNELNLRWFHDDDDIEQRPSDDPADNAKNMIEALHYPQIAECISSWLLFEDVKSVKLVSKIWNIKLKYIKVPSVAELSCYYQYCDEQMQKKKKNIKIRLYHYKAVWGKFEAGRMVSASVFDRTLL